MTRSELINKLQRELEALGDDYLLSYKIEDCGGSTSWFRTSLTRKNLRGRGYKMNKKEFRDYVIDERTKASIKRS